MKQKDVNEIAFATLQQAIGAIPKNGCAKRKAQASKLGSRRGKKGGNARAALLSQSRRSEMARLAAVSTWAKKRG